MNTIPVWIGIALSYFFPYAGLTINKWGFYILILLSYLNFLNFEPNDLKIDKHFFYKNLTELFFGIVLIPQFFILVAHFIFKNESVLLGVILASISPAAIINPLFVKTASDKKSTAIYVFSSHVLFPCTIFLYLKFLKIETLKLALQSFLLDTAWIIFVPLVLWLFSRKKIRPLIGKLQAPLNLVSMILLGILIFIFLSSTSLKTNLEIFSSLTLFEIFIFAFLQDFGIYFISKIFFRSQSQAISYSLKNVALPGAVLLIYHPQAAIVCTFVLLVHAFAFTYFSYLNSSDGFEKKSDKKSKELKLFNLMGGYNTNSTLLIHPSINNF